MTDTLNNPNQLEVVVAQTGLEQNKVDYLLKRFAAYFTEAKKIAEESKGLVVTDESQVEIMNKAREARLQLKSLRVAVEKVRVELKEQSLREGRAIDGVANLIKALVVPVEEHLEKQEKFIEVREMERLQKKLEDRISRLSAVVEDVSLYNLKDMSDDVFENLYEACKKEYDRKQAEKARIEAEQAEELRKDKLENERMLELAPYRQFTGELTVDLRTLPDKEYQTILSVAKGKKEEYDAEQLRIRKENEELRKKQEAERIANEKKLAEEKRIADEKIAAERKAREEAEAKLKAEKEAQAKKEADAKAAEEAIKREADEKERQAVLAPDKVKLTSFAANIDEFIDKYSPALKSESAQKILNEAEKLLKQSSNLIKEGVKTL